MEKAVAIVATVAALTLPACSALGGSQLLSASIGYWMTWTYTNTSVTITLTANTTGFLGLGFSPTGGMVGADIVTVTSLGGIVSIQDRHGVSTSVPPLDAKQDYVLIYGSVSNGQMKATFTRALDTCDPDDMPIKQYTMKVIYCYGSVNASGVPQYHASNRGTVNVYILNTVPAAPADTGVFSIDPIPKLIAVVNTTVTSYWCSIVIMPNVTNKSHIIQMQPIITPGNEDIVHHILVYSCSSVNLNFTSFNLFSGLDGGNTATCSSIIAGWAIGGQGYTFPLNVGLPIGGGNSPQYVLIQTHYHNVKLMSGRTDASYIRFKVTPNLRQYDAGILETGVVDGIFVPPNVTQMLISGYCSSDCLSSANVPATGINIFSVFFHSNLIGRRMTLRNIRSSPIPQIAVIADDPHYDVEFQEIWNLDTYFQVLPGDALQTICNMSSVNRSVATQGGYSLIQEMCLTFLFYYPKINLKTCLTTPPFAYNPSDSVYQLLGKNYSSFSWFNSGTNDGLLGARWSTQLTQAIQNEYFTGVNEYSCSNNSITQSLFMLHPLAISPLPNTSSTSAACSQAVTPTTYSMTSSFTPSKSESTRPSTSHISHHYLVIGLFIVSLLTVFF